MLFSSRLLLCLELLASTFLAASALLALAVREWHLFVFSNQVFVFLVEILSFFFLRLVNSEYDSYLPVDQSLVYSHSTM